MIFAFSCFSTLFVFAQNPITLTEDMEISALDFSSRSDETAICVEEYWIINNDEALVIRGPYGTERNVSYTVNVENAGTYNFGVRMAIWRNTNDNPFLRLLIDGNEVGSAMVPYCGDWAKPDGILDLCDMGNYYLTEGEHTITLSTMWGETTYVQSIKASLTGLKVSDQSVFVDESKNVNYEFIPADSAVDDLLWESDDVEVCTVTDGVISGISEGTTYVTVRSESKPELMAKFKVMVTKPTVGDPYDGKPFEISGETNATVIYAAKINKNAGDGGDVYDFMGGNGTIETNIDNMAVRPKKVGDYWYYTIDVKEAGLYKIDILATSGYTNIAADGGGRFKMTIGKTVIADENFVLPPFTDAKPWYLFIDDDKTSLGSFWLQEGIQTIKISVPVLPPMGEVQFRKIWFSFVPTLKDIEVADPNVSVGRGKSKQLKYKLIPENVVVDDLQWESSDTSVCTVVDGVVSGVSRGNATVILSSPSYPNIRGEWQINVGVTADSITLNKTSLSLDIGDSVLLTAIVNPSDADDKTIIWQSSNREVVSVDNGTVIAKATGKATVTAVCSDVSAVTEITVASTGNSGGTGGSGSAGGGSVKYIPPVYEPQKVTVNNEFNINSENVEATKSEVMNEIFKTADTIKYNVNSNRILAEINSEFFTENPASKSLIYSLSGATVIVGADTLNKLNPNNNSKIKLAAEIQDNTVTIDLSLDGKSADDLNGALKVQLPSKASSEYSVVFNGKEISSVTKDGYLIFIPDACGTYIIEEKSYAYDDLKHVVWAVDDILKAIDKGWLKPSSTVSFGANEAIKRGEFVSAVIKTLGLKAETSEGFDDVLQDNEYFYEITAAKALNIVNGIDGRNFMPNSNISRQDMAIVVCNALAAAGRTLDGESEKFLDDAQIADYAREAVYKLAGAQILKGSEIGFNPCGNTTRAESAVLLSRIEK